jgi:hypothetical protein
LEKIQDIISKRFQDAEDLNESLIFAFEIELDSRLVECIFPEFQPNVCDLGKIKKNFHQLVNIFILPLGDGSGYYWEVWDIHLNTGKKMFMGCATAYLRCI